jgi:5,5'-dehydrodivanillate O-demethylase
VIQYFGMPNINYILGGVGKPGREWENPDGSEALFIRVPVDDEHHLHFELRWVKNEGKSKDNPPSQNSPPVQLVNKVSSELLDAVLAGTIHLDEITDSDRTGFNLFWLQDNVSMLGQGVRWERKNEHLGRADVGIILLRKLWARELRALAEGQPLQEWRRTPDMVPRVAALPRAQR